MAMNALKINFKIIAALTFALLHCVGFAMNDSVRWSYGDEANWGELSSAYAECKLGKSQSPINIPTNLVKKAGLPPIKVAYESATGEILNNGHTIQVDLNNAGTAILPNGRYKLVQLHFHTPSEEQIDGQSYPLVAHLVHKNEIGQLAVIALLFKDGKENKYLTPIFLAMPNKEGRVALNARFNAATILPASLEYYSFAGSLATPPCSEDVSWQVLKNPVDISSAQLAAFRAIYPMNARPIQPLNGRVIHASE
jgi:carbonic anhydrase